MMTIMTTEVHFISCHKKRALLRWSKRRQTIRERSKENQGTILLPQYDHDLVPFKKLKYEKVNLELSQVNIRGFTSSLSSSKPRSTTRFFILRNTLPPPLLLPPSRCTKSWKFSKYFWTFKGKKLKSLRMSQKSFLDNKKITEEFPYVGGWGVNPHMENSICFVVFFLLSKNDFWLILRLFNFFPLKVQK